jgi:MSHA biogenesis protein MshP
MTSGTRSRGFALVYAVFLIAVLAGLGVTLATLSKAQQDTGVRSLLADKVYYGARAGLEWGIHQRVSSAALACAVLPAAPSSTTFTLTQQALSGVSVTVECTQSEHGSATELVFYITSTATIGTLGSVDYAERRLEATVSNIP